MLTLRNYQNRSMDFLRDGFMAKHRAQILYLPTGAGKTEIAIAMMQEDEQRGNSCAMVMDRRVLCDQTSNRLLKYNIDHGVLMAGHERYRPSKPIQICTAQTLEARGGFPGLNLLIVDECHCKRKSITDFIKNNEDVRVIGLSASPFTKGLGKIYSNVVGGITTKELVESGNLAPLRVFIAKEIDMAGAKKVAGEWSDRDASERGIKITADVVEEWTKLTTKLYGEPKKTIVFCAGVAHGQDLSRKFNEAGFNFVSISYLDDEDTKERIFKEFAKPDSSIHGLIATDILTKGFDAPDVIIGISARPFSKSFSSHVQQMGRVMRSFEGKKEAVWICHSGNYLRFQKKWDKLYAHGVDALHEGEEKVQKELKQEEKAAKKCPQCGSLWMGGSTCNHCGYERIRTSQVETLMGAIIELGEHKKEKIELTSAAYKELFYQQLLGYCRQYGKSDGYAYHLYIAKFGKGPPWKKVAMEPRGDVINFIKSRQIAYQKSRRV